MQTFSNMQRNSLHKTNLTYFIIFLLLVVYESISSIYLYLTPLFGVAFYFLLINIYKKDHFFPNFLTILYIFIFEVDKGFIPFSFIIFFIIYYFFILDKIEHFFSKKSYKIFFHIFNIYIGYYIINLILSYLFNCEIPSFDFKYLLYIVTDTLIVIIL